MACVSVDFAKTTNTSCDNIIGVDKLPEEMIEINIKDDKVETNASKVVYC